MTLLAKANYRAMGVAIWASETSWGTRKHVLCTSGCWTYWTEGLARRPITRAEARAELHRAGILGDDGKATL